jgi:hypothetical protein
MALIKPVVPVTQGPMKSDRSPVPVQRFESWHDGSYAPYSNTRSIDPAETKRITEALKPDI